MPMWNQLVTTFQSYIITEKKCLEKELQRKLEKDFL